MIHEQVSFSKGTYLIKNNQKNKIVKIKIGVKKMDYIITDIQRSLFSIKFASIIFKRIK